MELYDVLVRPICYTCVAAGLHISISSSNVYSIFGQTAHLLPYTGILITKNPSRCLQEIDV